MFNKLILSAAFLLTTAVAQAKDIQLIREDHVKGSEVYRIKRSVYKKLQEEGLNPQDFQLEGVTLRAKSLGGGSATLNIGGDRYKRKVKEVDVFQFLASADSTYKTMVWDLDNIEGQSDEAWRMKLSGNIKVDDLIAHLSRKTERIRIPMRNQVFKGTNTLRLKRMLNDMGYNPKKMKLRKVIVVGKSRKGGGTAELTIAKKSRGVKTLKRAKAGYNFASNEAKSYNRVRWNVKGAKKGAWQIQLQGRNKLRAVIVEVM